MNTISVVFTSNFLSIHQIPFCDMLYKLLGDNFKFIATEKLPEERIKLGYVEYENDYPYVVNAHISKTNEELALKYANDCDVLIQGSAPINYALDRFKNNKIVFNYCERLFKDGFKIMLDIRCIRTFYIRHTANRNKNVYVLCASAFTSYDLKRIFAYPNKMFKWGYFPKAITYDSDILMQKTNNEIIEILWAGRMIDWKHPEKAIYLAKYLKDKKYSFKLNMIGTGYMENKLKNITKKLNLENEVIFLGSMPSEKVREYMEKANIYVFTSNKEEGWGAVLNEAMNAGCAVVASNKIGAVPYLINNGENGIIYNERSNQDFFEKVESLMNKKELMSKIGRNAYNTITDLWNSEVATLRMLNVFNELVNNQKLVFYESGPMSQAEILKG